MGFYLNLGFKNEMPIEVERNALGNFFYTLFSNKKTNSNRNISEKQMLDAMLFNPAFLKVISLNTDLGSLVDIKEKTNSDKSLHDFLKKPNSKQNWTQFFWDYYFWLHYGTAYLYRSQKNYNDNLELTWLNPTNIDWNKLNEKTETLFLSRSLKSDINNHIVYYQIGRKKIPLLLGDITPFYDTTNSLNGEYFKGQSKIPALYKVLQNSESSLDAKKQNLDFSQEFLTSGQIGLDDLSNPIMSDPEKQSIKSSLLSKNTIHATKTPITIKRFVDDIARLKLDESFYNDYFMIGTMFGVPKDVLESNIKGSTFENQEKATGKHIEYALAPKIKMLCEYFNELFSVDDLGGSWSHLSFNQVFEKEKSERKKIDLENLKLAKELGLSEEIIKNQILSLYE